MKRIPGRVRSVFGAVVERKPETAAEQPPTPVPDPSPEPAPEPVPPVPEPAPPPKHVRLLPPTPRKDRVADDGTDFLDEREGQSR